MVVKLSFINFPLNNPLIHFPAHFFISNLFRTTMEVVVYPKKRASPCASFNAPFGRIFASGSNHDAGSVGTHLWGRIFASTYLVSFSYKFNASIR
jgi:hypothetical protein